MKKSRTVSDTGAPSTADSPPSDITLLILPRTARTEIRLCVSSFRQKPTIDLRLYFRTESGEWLPSRKGCSLHPSELPELLAAMESAGKEVGHE